MVRTLFAICICSLAIGCNDGNTGSTSPADAAKIKKKALSYAEGWADMGMWLPKEDQVAFFATNIETTKEVLAENLSHENSDIRQRAAYIIEKIGPTAKPLQKPLVTALSKEKESLIRIYFCNALSALGEADEEVLVELRSLLKTPDDSEEALKKKIYVQAALSTLSKEPREITECTEFVCQWLKIPQEGMGASELEK